MRFHSYKLNMKHKTGSLIFAHFDLLTRARVAVSATFAMVGGGPKWPPSNSKTRKARRPGDTAIDSF